MSAFEPCPFCAKEEATPVRFTPWGGVVGPMVFSLVKCEGCGKQFNGKNGRRVEQGIKIYTWVTLLTLVGVAAWAIYAYVGDKPAAGEAGERPALRRVVG